jgi:acyl-[acyl-carrier-protein]-phospholipid O-acyltransferase / long-chain-fatty-acid--[acyl-carrier-protein] ligase
MSKLPPHDPILPRKFLRMCRRRMWRPKVADSTGAELTGADLLMRTLILRRLLRREVLAHDEQNVGLLLPPSVAAVVANAAMAIDCRVAVNLNYTMTSEVTNDCIAQCGIRHVLTSRRVMERFDLKLNAELVYLEDFKDRATRGDKLAAAAMTWMMPVRWLERRLGLTKLREDDLLTIIFTSGSTGRPKGVMLTNRNVGANIWAIDQVLRLADDDVLLGILPVFHSFGYTTTMWTVLTLAPKGIYHHNPLEAREVGKLARRHGATIMIATPTFVRSYLRRCEPQDFALLDVVFTGAEKLSPDVAAAFEQRFGVRPVEGYGATELSPVVSANLPPSRAADSKHEGVKEGTVGIPLPGVAVKVVDLETGEDLGPSKSGMLLVAGPAVMKGYYNRPDLTAEVIRDEREKGDITEIGRLGGAEGKDRKETGKATCGGSRHVGDACFSRWYITGDVAVIDDDGFITITGRISRFSKLAGEMVPHIRVEEAIGKVLGLGEDDLKLVVTSVPDHKKGERLVVLYTELQQTPEEICRSLATGGLPALWVPSPDSFRRVTAIPVLGTGKLDLKRVKDLATAEFEKGE